MLRKITYKIIATLMLIPFLASATGISIFFHKCSCEGRVILTLFVEHKCHEEQTSSCCESKFDFVTITDIDSACGCKTEHVTLKVDDSFTNVITLNFNTNSELLAFILPRKVNLNLELAQSDNEVKHLYLPMNSPPIKPAGRILINLIHQSKTPDFVS